MAQQDKIDMPEPDWRQTAKGHSGAWPSGLWDELPGRSRFRSPFWIL